MKTYFARGVLALLWYLVFVAFVFAASANPDLGNACSPDLGVYALLFMAYVMASSVGLALYAAACFVVWLIESATASPGDSNAKR